MTFAQKQKILAVAIAAAKAAGCVMRKNLNRPKQVNSKTQHDIKLVLDVKCQKLIEKMLRKKFPNYAILGEEGILGDPQSAERWVVDPIDGTVNFTYGIPHACVSIAFQVKRKSPGKNTYSDGYETVAGVVYDPFGNELWTGIQGQPARLNGKIIKVSRRDQMEESIVSIGFAKSTESLEESLPYFNNLVRKVRKVRMMGAAALAMVYVATGRFDGYVERGIHLWDVAAGGLIVECAGGEFYRRAIPGNYTYRMVTTNGLLRKKLAFMD